MTLEGGVSPVTISVADRGQVREPGGLLAAFRPADYLTLISGLGGSAMPPPM